MLKNELIIQDPEGMIMNVRLLPLYIVQPFATESLTGKIPFNNLFPNPTNLKRSQ